MLIAEVSKFVHWTSQIIETDATYFETGATSRDHSDFRLVTASGLEHLAAGCLASRVSVVAAEANPAGWRAKFERAARDGGASLYRLYLNERAPHLEAELLANGYARRVESVFLTTGAAEQPTSADVDLREIVTEEDWRVKCLVDAESTERPDGYAAGSAAWDELLHRKWITGSLRFYVVEWKGIVCGTVGVMETSELLRLKNLVIRPSCRRLGLGTETTKAAWLLATTSGKSGIGVFCIQDSIGVRVYTKAGLEECGYVLEFSKPVSQR